MIRCLTGHYRYCSWPVKKASPGMCPCRWWTFWTPFANKLANNLQFFMSFWFKWLLSVHHVRFLLCWRVMVDRLTLLNSKGLSLLRTVNEKSKMLIFCTVLIFALIFMTFDRYLLYRWYKLTFETFYVHEKCKIFDFKYSKAMQQHT